MRIILIRVVGMHLTVISSLDALCRQQACEAASAAHPLATLVLHDLLENGLVIRRIYRQGTLVERAETHLEHGCLSCTVRLDVVPTVAALLDRGDGMVIIGLPPAVSSETAIGALRRGLPRSVIIDSAVLTCAPDTLEDHLWDHHTLFESGFTPVPEDHRTPGEFLMGELCFSDTVLLAEPALLPVDPALRRRAALPDRDPGHRPPSLAGKHRAVAGRPGCRGAAGSAGVRGREPGLASGTRGPLQRDCGDRRGDRCR